jgi:hypothetical protein
VFISASLNTVISSIEENDVFEIDIVNILDLRKGKFKTSLFIDTRLFNKAGFYYLPGKG